MRNAGLAFLLAVMAWLAAVPAMAEDGQTHEGVSNHIKAHLVAKSPTIPQNGDDTLVLDYAAEAGWHTYWTNPGDAGLPAKFKWNLPDGMSVTGTNWPAPKVLPTLGLTSYGYDEPVEVPITLHNGGDFKPGDSLPVSAHIDFLVCKDVCVPESLDVALTLKVGPTASGPDAGAVDKAVAALPQPMAGTIDLKGGQVELGFATSGQPQNAYFFPVQDGVFAPGDPQGLDLGPQGFALRVKAADTTLPDGALSGVLSMGDGHAYTVALSRAPLAPGVHGFGAAPAGKTDGSLGGILTAMAFAFLGGMILNLMPCVFPVLSMKLLSLSRAGHDAGAARTEALVYGGGATLSFVVLALVLMIAQSAGAALGWGFQLQSPIVTATLALVMLLVALNMSGFFEIGTSLQGFGGDLLNQDRPRLSAFMTGVLAVVVAAPCTAPFMATAIGVALAQGGISALVIFLSLGLGFALPFVALTYLITFVPAVAALLPRPGPWMDRLKQGLSVLMYLAALWLVWVFAQQVQWQGLVLLLFAFAIILQAIFVGRRFNLGKIPFFKPALLALGVVVTVLAAFQPHASKMHSMPSGLLPHKDFSTATLADLRSQGKPVLVDLTAAWCVTCKVNERLVLTQPAFAKALQDTGTVYMVGDWTNQDAEISNYLKLYGRSGVPLYVYYGPNNARAVILPQMLNTDNLVKLMRGGKA